MPHCDDNLDPVLTIRRLGTLLILGVVTILHGLVSVTTHPPYHNRLRHIQRKKSFSSLMAMRGLGQRRDCQFLRTTH